MAESKVRAETLRSFPLFENAKKETLALVASKATPACFAPDTVLLEVDQVSDKVYFITGGDVRISRVTSYGEVTTLRILHAPDVVGELGLLQDLNRSATVTCLSETRALVCDKGVFDTILKSDHAVTINLLKQLSERIRNANTTVIEALDNQHHAIETRFVKLNQLIEASKRINSSLNLDELLKLILEAAATSIEADRGTLSTA